MSNRILLVGAGPMAIEYAKVLNALQVDFVVAGRGKLSAQTFFDVTGKIVVENGIDDLISSKEIREFDAAIVAVTENMLGKVTRQLLGAGMKRILVEKPGGLDMEDIIAVRDMTQAKSAQVYVGYNRRCYAAVKEAKRLIEEDGGVTSFNFEFTEWGHIISDLKKAEGVKDEWFLANSSHVVDLAFYLGGKPIALHADAIGSSKWHPRAMVYAGSGETNEGALFTYSANWDAPGRWGVEVLTTKHRIYLRPLEKLQIQNKGTISIELIEIDYSNDENYKPGLFLQVKDFMSDECKLLTIEEQCKMLPVYDIIERGGAL